MKRLSFTDAAENDLEAIGDYIAEDSPTQALRLVRELRLDCAKLTTMPKRHPLLPGYGSTGIRRRVFGNYLIFYRVEADAIEILHIVHGAMNYEAVLFPDD